LYRWISGIAVGIALVAALGVGCGGGDESEASVQLTKAQFTKQASGICEDMFEKRLAARRKFDEKFDPNEEKTESLPYLGKKVTALLIPSMQSGLEELEGLEPPPAIKADVEKMLETYAAAIEEFETKGVVALKGSKPVEDFNKESRALGLSCEAP